MIGEMNDLENKTESEMKSKMPKKFIIQKRESEDFIQNCKSTSELGNDEQFKAIIQINQKMGESFLSSLLQNNENQEKSESEIESISSECNDLSKAGKTFNTGRWTEEEHKKFLEAILIYGNEWKKVQKCILTRSSTQARSHAQKFFLRIKKNLKNLEDHNVLIEKRDEVQENSMNENEPLKDSALLKLLFKISSSGDNLKIKANNLLGGILSSSQRQKLMNVIVKFSSGMDIPKKARKKSLECSDDDEYESNEDSSEDNTIEENNSKVKKQAIFLISKVQRLKRVRINSEKNQTNTISFEQKNPLMNFEEGNGNLFEGLQKQLSKASNFNWYPYQRMMPPPNLNHFNLFNVNPGQEHPRIDSCNINEIFPLERYIRNPPAGQGFVNSVNCAVSGNNYVQLTNLRNNYANTMYDELKTYFIKIKKYEPRPEISKESILRNIHRQQHIRGDLITEDIFDSMNFFFQKHMKKNVSSENLNEELMKNPFALNFDQVLDQTKNMQEALKEENSNFHEGESMKVEFDDYNNIS